MTAAPAAVTLSQNPLLESVKVGHWQLAHRIVYAPLTRQRAIDNVPQPAAATYYAQRATKGGLMISEATVVSAEGRGYAHTPGIWSKEQVEAWKPIIKAVHDKGAVFLCQLWHTGRASHPAFQEGGKDPVAPSAIAIPDAKVFLPDGSQAPYTKPRALDISEIPARVDAFRQGARNALDAGFDGVEIHSANGYLLDNFLKASCNQRTDKYGGTIENRARFTLEVVDAVVKEVGDSQKVGIRFSPFYVLGAEDPHKNAVFTYVVEELNSRNLAYVHMIEPRKRGSEKEGSPSALFDYTQRDQNLSIFRIAYTGTFMVAGGHDRESGIQSLKTDRADLIVYGRHFLANPDFVKRIELNAPLNQYDRTTFYSQDQEKGYTDYPYLEE
ncbi:hypothetical protein WJX73_004673 [Symbiochloris irregularis]|uniref:NADH:flavin oxidoreductase/NADH oxidase N-terminal domain-containing protein n=1 Tax=Symbiochloris irregularis TaxID=706552 RepID=A0AAW1PDQ1_9CHLO